MKVVWHLVWAIVISTAVCALLYWASEKCFFAAHRAHWLVWPALLGFFFFFLAGDNRQKILTSLAFIALAFIANATVFQENIAVPVIETETVKNVTAFREQMRLNPRSRAGLLSEDRNYRITYVPEPDGFRIEAVPRLGCCFVLRAFTVDAKGNIYWAWPTRAASPSDSPL